MTAHTGLRGTVHRLWLGLLVGAATSVTTAQAGEPAQAVAQPAVRHPNLFLNREEVEQVKAKIRQCPWAAQGLERLKELSQNRQATHMEGGLKSALVYVLTDDRKYAEAARRELLGIVQAETPKFENADLRVSPVHREFAPISAWAWSYDLIHETLSDGDRQAVENLLRAASRTVIGSLWFHSTTPSPVFTKHWQVGVVGYCLGEKEFIDWGLSDPGRHGPGLGGFYPVLDTMVGDGYPSQGLAVLRSDETPRYWTTSATAAVLRLGAAIGHGHKDYLQLLLRGKGRLLYPDLQLIGYEPTYQHWTADATWQADWVQHSAGAIPGIQAFGKAWFERTVGVRMTMLGAAGTEVYVGDGPITDSPPYGLIEGNSEGSFPINPETAVAA